MKFIFVIILIISINNRIFSNDILLKRVFSFKPSKYVYLKIQFNDGIFNFYKKDCIEATNLIGSYKIAGNKLSLKYFNLSKITDLERELYFKTEFIILKHLNNLYLIPINEISIFINEIIQGFIPNYNSIFFENKDHLNNNLKFENNLNQYKDKLKIKLNGKIIGINSHGEYTINLGKKDKIFENMFLTYVYENSYSQLKIIKVNENSSQAIIVFSTSGIKPKIFDSVFSKFPLYLISKETSKKNEYYKRIFWYYKDIIDKLNLTDK